MPDRRTVALLLVALCVASVLRIAASGASCTGDWSLRAALYGPVPVMLWWIGCR